MLNSLGGMLLANVALVVPAEIQELDEHMPLVLLAEIEGPFFELFLRLWLLAQVGLWGVGFVEEVFQLVDVSLQANALGDELLVAECLVVGVFVVLYGLVDEAGCLD